MQLRFFALLLLAMTFSCTEAFMPSTMANKITTVSPKGIEATTRKNAHWEPGANPNEGYPEGSASVEF